MGYEGKSGGYEGARGGGRRRKKGDRGRERASEIKAATAEGQWRGNNARYGHGVEREVGRERQAGKEGDKKTPRR